MKLISWNVNGLRACINKGFYEYFKASEADIFCLQETKMQPGQAEIISEGYHQYMNSAVRKGYSGTMVFTRKEPLSVTFGLGIEEHDQEGRVITCEYETVYLVRLYGYVSLSVSGQSGHLFLVELSLQRAQEQRGLAHRLFHRVGPAERAHRGCFDPHRDLWQRSLSGRIGHRTVRHHHDRVCKRDGLQHER